MQMSPDAEWLEADGRGGFAFGTPSVRTRRYHALLLADRPAGRFLLVNGLEAWVETASGPVTLTAQAYAGTTTLPGATLLAFTPVPWPSWRLLLPDGTEIQHELLVARDGGQTLLRWRASQAVTLRLRLLMSGRDYHALHSENPAFDATPHEEGGALVWRPYPGVPATAVRGDFAYRHDPSWYRRFTYATDEARGLHGLEDLASPGIFTAPLAPGGEAVLILRADAADATQAATLLAAEATRRRRPEADVAADIYLADRGAGRTIVAGFPWFTDWGRDTFIALRGLLLARGRLQEAADILLAWAGHVSEGMLPNRFPDGAGPPDYNAVDASLWFIIAVHELTEAGGASRPVIARLRAACLAILEGYSAGTRYGIALDPVDGLLRAGVPGVQLTWMDAKIGERVITPRIGKPVEVQALWVNALAIAGRWPGGERWLTAALRARDSVLAHFPDPATGGLIDVLDDGHVPGARDGRVRPNQVLAAGGLPIPVLTPQLIRGVVALAERRLLTPLGLRSLAPGEPGYCPHYAGDQVARDEAYHQGTVWPWLIGPFVAAWLAARGNTAAARVEARSRFLPPLQRHLHTHGLGHVSEVADADPPHAPGGCPFQAWSLGELLRLEAMLKEP